MNKLDPMRHYSPKRQAAALDHLLADIALVPLPQPAGTPIELTDDRGTCYDKGGRVILPPSEVEDNGWDNIDTSHD